ncbi:MAG TPA: organomercurial lyase [Polyangia bacterium]|nr:organomercurial lyase [Polyangia bacterium]
MVHFRSVPAPWLVVAALAGAAIGAVGAMRARPPAACSTGPAGGASKPGCCHGAGDAQAVKCPVHWGTDDVVVDDRGEAERVRRALVDGIFRFWTERGQAPTPAEFAQRMKLPRTDADRLLDEMQACGEAVGSGILRVPESELIAVAWPFANVPTGITVTTAGGKPAFARCAYDALGVSQLLGQQTTVEAEAHDSLVRLRVVVDGDKIISANPAGFVVVKGKGCDNMSFFSSRQAAETWRTAHEGEGQLLTLAEAVQRAAKSFGRYATGL